MCENITRACVSCVILTLKEIQKNKINKCNDLTLTVVGYSGMDINSSRPILRVLISHP